MRSTLTSFAFVLLACACAQAQPGLEPATVSQINNKVAEFMSRTGTPGVSVAVVKDGALVWSTGYGLADLENFVPATNETMYRLGSVSKPITATGAMWLAEHGKLDLDAEIQKYCPAFPKKQWPITTRELLGHFGGIRHYKHDDPALASTRRYASMEEALQIFANDDLVAPPGTKFNYSTFGYTLVGCVIEGASGKRYIDFIHEVVFIPAAMSRIQTDDEHTIIPHRAQGYQKDKAGNILNSDLADTSYKIPGGGMISDAEDLGRFEVALLDDKLLKSGTRQQMWTPQKAADGSENLYALGWGTGADLGFPSVGHSGSQQRISTAIRIEPEKKDGVVVLCNLEDVDAAKLAGELLRIIVALPIPH
jgi:serine beta-lactamase-like protein LACTB, mitochondrial